MKKKIFFSNRLRGLEIIGEATKNLSEGLKAKYPQIPWKEIAGLRDKLIHQYFGVNLDLVLETIKQNYQNSKVKFCG